MYFKLICALLLIAVCYTVSANLNSPLLAIEVVDKTNGSPAADVAVLLYKIHLSGLGVLYDSGRTNSEGKYTSPLTEKTMPTGKYKLFIKAGEFYNKRNITVPEPFAIVTLLEVKEKEHYFVKLEMSAGGELNRMLILTDPQIRYEW